MRNFDRRLRKLEARPINMIERLRFAELIVKAGGSESLSLPEGIEVAGLEEALFCLAGCDERIPKTESEWLDAQSLGFGRLCTGIDKCPDRFPPKIEKLARRLQKRLNKLRPPVTYEELAAQGIDLTYA